MKLFTIDVGGTFIKYALIDDGNILSKGKKETKATTLDEYLAFLEALIKDNWEDAEGVACSMPGVIDAENGYMYTGGALRFVENINMKEELEKRIGKPVEIINDAKSAALAEVYAGVLCDINDAIVITAGTGVGGALIKDRKVHQGKHFFAGEFSFMFMNHSKEASFNETVPAHLSVPGLTKKLANIKNDETIDGIKLLALVRENDEDAVRLFTDFCDHYATLIFNLQAVFDPQAIAIGGGMSADPLFVDSIRASLDNIYNKYFMPCPRAELRTCKFLNDANLIGAYHFFTSKH